MKKTILSILTLLVVSTSVNAQNVNIPDVNFKTYLVGDPSINTNGDTEIQVSEAIAYNGTINCNSLSISDLTGIEEFTALTTLTCVDNSLTSLDVTQNTALAILQCGSNSLSVLDVTQNIALSHLYCNDNSLSSLDVTQNSVLAWLNCQENYSLSSLDVTQNPDLMSLRCFDNALTSLDVTQNPDLIQLYCHYNSINSLDLTQNTSLIQLDCYDNSLSTLNIANGNNANMNSNNFDATYNPNLTCIQVDDVAYSNANWTDIDASASFSLNCSVVLVSSITIQGQGGANTITVDDGTLQMEATVLPANASDLTFAWSVMDGTGTASIDANGLLTALTNGTVTVLANANDASGVVGSLTITISNQTVGIDENIGLLSQIEIYPNPVQNELFIDLGQNQATQISILNVSGQVVQSIANINVKSIDVSGLNQGIYILKIQTESGISTNRFVKK